MRQACPDLVAQHQRLRLAGRLHHRVVHVTLKTHTTYADQASDLFNS